MNFLKQLWPWTRQRQYMATFIAEIGSQVQSIGDMIITTQGRVDAVTLREVSRSEITKKLEEKGHQVKDVTIWLQRVV